MSLRWLRPWLPDGKLPSTDPNYTDAADYGSWGDWDTADIVDAEVLQKNIACLSSHLNGNLCNSDVDLVNTRVLESLYIWNEGRYNPHTGYRHGHDGIDSARLAPNSVGYSILKTIMWSILRIPSKAFRGLIMHGRVSNDLLDTKASYNTWTVALPFDTQRFQTNYLYRGDPTYGCTRMMLSRVIPNLPSLSTKEVGSLALPYMDFGDSGHMALIYIHQKANEYGTSYAVDATGTFNWLVCGLV